MMLDEDVDNQRHLRLNDAVKIVVMYYVVQEEWYDVVMERYCDDVLGEVCDDVKEA